MCVVLCGFVFVEEGKNNSTDRMTELESSETAQKFQYILEARMTRRRPLGEEAGESWEMGLRSGTERVGHFARIKIRPLGFWMCLVEDRFF